MATNSPIELLIALGVNTETSKRNIQKSLDSIKKDLNLNIDIGTTSNSNATFAKLQLEIMNLKRQVDDLKDGFKGIGNEKINTSSFEKFEDALRRIDRTFVRLQDTGKATSGELEYFRKALNNLDPKNLKGASDLLKDMRERVIDLNREFKIDEGINSQVRALNKLSSDLKKLETQYGKTLDPAQARALRSEIERLSRLEILDVGALRNAQSETKNLRESIRQLRESTADTSVATNDLGNSLATAFKKYATYVGVSSVFYGISTAVKDVTQNVIELDTALTNLRRVSDIDEFAFNTVLERSIENVTQLSGLLPDYLNLVNEFARTGKDDVQSLDLANTATTLQNISELTADESFSTLTAATVVYGDELERTVDIADKLNEVNINSLLLW